MVREKEFGPKGERETEGFCYFSTLVFFTLLNALPGDFAQFELGSLNGLRKF